jgi:hypothetical protein
MNGELTGSYMIQQEVKDFFQECCDAAHAEKDDAIINLTKEICGFDKELLGHVFQTVYTAICFTDLNMGSYLIGFCQNQLREISKGVIDKN